MTRRFSRSLPIICAALSLGLAACNPEAPEEEPQVLPVGPAALDNARHATGSSSIVATDDALYNVNTMSGTLTRTTPETGRTLEVDVGVEPSRVAVADGRVFVSLRGERAVVMLKENGLRQGVQERVNVGAEPVGLVVREDGRRVYVALSQENRVAELHGETLEILRTFSVPAEPRYLALHPSGGGLFVGSGRGEARLHRIDLQDGTRTEIELPHTWRPMFDEFGENHTIDLVPRITGDLWVSPDGSRLLVPTMYADTETPIADFEVEPGEEIRPPEEPGVEGYGGEGSTVDKFNPAVVEVEVDAEGAPSGETRALFVSQTAFGAGFPTDFDTDPNTDFGEEFFGTIGSYVSSVSASPDGETWLITMEASKASILVDPDSEVFGGGVMVDAALPEPGPDGDAVFAPFVMPQEAGFAAPALVPFFTGEGTDGAVFYGDEAWAHARFDDRVAPIDLELGREFLQMSAESQFNMGEAFFTSSGVQVTETPLSDELKAGRSLFFSATNTSMGSGGISCSTCHFEGRNDGLTWTFEGGQRQTPSLAGVVSDTAPVTWTSNVESVAMEADITTRGRMGGGGLDPVQLEAIAAFVDFTRLPDTPSQGFDNPAVLRGQALFQSAELGCSSCHAGERGTDNNSYSIRGQLVNTPPLTGVAGTAPYLSDGSAPTLRAVLEWARGGEMGDTSSLTDAEMDDLEAYLRSL